MEINIWCIKSLISEQNRKMDEAMSFLHSIETEANITFNMVDANHLNETKVSLIFVASGGSENAFLREFNNIKQPYYILSTQNNNSLAASLEILTFIHEHNKQGEILHGTSKDVAKRLLELIKEKNNG